MLGRTTARAMLVPALGLLAACTTDPRYSSETTVIEPPPALPGALGTPVMPSGVVAGDTVVPGVVAAPGTPMRLSAMEVTAALANNTAEGRAANGLPYAIYFSSTGEERFRQGRFRDVGVWRVLPDGRFCSRLALLSANSEQCYVMYRSGNTVAYQLSDGVTLGSVVITPGDPLAL
ncbi:MAG TPA: hypothetical protein VET85_10595 [Stellaceae bacterium]|nr:hypothetical protein [Stellaceae bacterium]